MAGLWKVLLDTCFDVPKECRRLEDQSATKAEKLTSSPSRYGERQQDGARPYKRDFMEMW